MGWLRWRCIYGLECGLSWLLFETCTRSVQSVAETAHFIKATLSPFGYKLNVGPLLAETVFKELSRDCFLQILVIDVLGHLMIDLEPLPNELRFTGTIIAHHLDFSDLLIEFGKLWFD